VRFVAAASRPGRGDLVGAPRAGYADTELVRSSIGARVAILRAD